MTELNITPPIYMPYYEKIKKTLEFHPIGFKHNPISSNRRTLSLSSLNNINFNINFATTEDKDFQLELHDYTF